MYEEDVRYTHISRMKEYIKGHLNYMTQRHCKVLLVRFDLRFPAGTCHQIKNEEISGFIKSLTNYYTDRGVEIRYLWAREQLTSEAPHYHVALLLNGSLIQHPMSVWNKAAEIWSRITNGPTALLHQCWLPPVGQDGNGGIMIRRATKVSFGDRAIAEEDVYQNACGAAEWWMSYLAKDESKENTPPGVRRYGSSQL